MEMKKVVILALAGVALSATPALAAPISGSVDITGTVGAKCSLSPSTDSLDDTVSLNSGADMADANTGQLGAWAASASYSFSHKLICTGSTVTVALTAVPPVTTTGAATTGYTNRIDYNATLTAVPASGANAVATGDSTTALGASASATTADRLSTTVGDNLTIKLDNFHTATSTDVLMAGSYGATVTYSVTPNA